MIQRDTLADRKSSPKRSKLQWAPMLPRSTAWATGMGIYHGIMVAKCSNKLVIFWFCLSFTLIYFDYGFWCVMKQLLSHPFYEPSISGAASSQGPSLKVDAARLAIFKGYKGSMAEARYQPCCIATCCSSAICRCLTYQPSMSGDTIWYNQLFFADGTLW